MGSLDVESLRKQTDTIMEEIDKNNQRINISDYLDNEDEDEAEARHSFGDEFSQ